MSEKKVVVQLNDQNVEGQQKPVKTKVYDRNTQIDTVLNWAREKFNATRVVLIEEDE